MGLLRKLLGKKGEVPIKSSTIYNGKSLIRKVSEKQIARPNKELWLPETLTVSPNERKVAWLELSKDNYFVLLNGKKVGKYRYFVLKSLVFSPDSRRFAYIAAEDPKQYAVINGEEGKRYDFVTDICFSKNGSRIAYGASEIDKWFVVENEDEGKRYNDLLYNTITFSPENEVLAYGVKEKEDCSVSKESGQM